MSLTGTEVLRLVRAGQVDIGASPLSTVSGDVPFLDGVDLAGLHPEITPATSSNKCSASRRSSMGQATFAFIANGRRRMSACC